jgi:hypothetical protein
VISVPYGVSGYTSTRKFDSIYFVGSRSNSYLTLIEYTPTSEEVGLKEI